MKIIHLISGCFGQGGAERLVADLAEAQIKLGHDVIICTYRDLNKNSLLIPSGVKHHSFGKKKGLSPNLVFAIKSYLKTEKPDIVNCHLPAVFLYLIPSLLFCKNIKFFYTIHNDPIQEESRPFVRALRKHFINNGRLQFIAISETIKSSFEVLYGVSGIEMIYNGRRKIDKSPAFENVNKEVDLYKRDKDTKVFVAVGRLTSVKNHKLMIESFAKHRLDNIVLLILGQGDQTQFNNVFSNNVHLLGPKDNVYDYLYCADAFCMSSTYEGFPISIIEAMSIGLPIISTKVGGIPDIIKEEENGFLSSSLEVDDYVNVITKYLSTSDSDLSRISELNKKEFTEKYDINCTAKHYLALYRRSI